MSKDFFVDRELYRTIKSMSKNELSALIRKIYIMGQEDAVKKIYETSFEKIRAEISAIKGIGEKRSAQIMGIISKNIL